MAWTNTLPDQVRAVAQMLARSAVPLTLPDVQGAFTGPASGAGSRSWQTACPPSYKPSKPSTGRRRQAFAVAQRLKGKN